MKLSRNFLFIFLAAVPILIHFYSLQVTLVNFPSWGDDFLFFETIEHFQSDGFVPFINYLFKPHNQIHVLLFGKVFVLVGFLITGSLNFKTLILLANLLLLGIAYLIYRFLQANKYASWHLIPILCLLFAPHANGDNYHVIGVLQHTGSLFFLTWIAYVSTQKKSKWALLLALSIYPFVSTEGWVMLPIIGFYLFYKQHPFKYIVGSMSIFAFIGLGFLVFAKPAEGQSSSLLQIILQAPLALFTFLGNAAWPVSDTYKIYINAAFGLLAFSLSSFCLWKNIRQKNAWEMPAILWLQILATGAMICVGRSQGNTIATLVLSERFFTYGIFALISTYLLLIPIFDQFAIKNRSILAIAFLYFIGSYYFYETKQGQLGTRLRADLTNAFYTSSSTSYPIPSQALQTLLHAPYFQVDSTELLPRLTEKTALHTPLHAAMEIGANGHITLKINNIPSKESFLDARWIAMQSITNPDSSIVCSLVSDQANKQKVLHLNSLQLTNLTQKHVYLYTQKASGHVSIQYLGSL
jgi:hypothetical protein